MKKIYLPFSLILALSLLACKKQTEDMAKLAGISEIGASSQSNLLASDQIPDEFKNAIRLDATTDANVSAPGLRSATSIIESYGPYGSVAGSTFGFFPPDAGSKIAGIGIAPVGGTKVQGFNVYYKTVNGTNVYYSTGNTANMRYYQFSADEYIMRVSGRSGALLDQLTITTNKTSLSVGGTGGTPFSHTVPKGDQILGFRGRSDVNINQISFEVYCKPWQLLAGSGAKDIAVAQDGTAYMTNSNGSIYRLLPFTTSGWTQMAGSAGVSIAANANRVCLVNSVGKIYELYGSSWRQLVGSGAKDVTINSDGKIWMVNSNGSIYRFNETSWQRMPGSDAVRIASGAGQVWIINTSGNIYRYTGTSWSQTVGSAARDIAVGSDGAVWLTNTSGNIYSWTGSAWTEICGSAGYHVASNNRKVFLVNSSGRIYNLIY